MTAPALPRNIPPPRDPPDFYAAEFRRLLARAARRPPPAPAPLPEGSTLADHERARREALERETPADRAARDLADNPEALRREAEALASSPFYRAISQGARPPIGARAPLAAPERTWSEAPPRSCSPLTDNVSTTGGAESGVYSQVVGAQQLSSSAPPGNEISAATVERRKKRRDMRHDLRPISTQTRLQSCGVLVVPSALGVTIAAGASGAAHYAGVAACGLLWICPVCSAKISHERQGQVEQLLQRHYKSGGGALFLTFTVSHQWKDELKKLRRDVANLYRYLLSGREGAAIKKQWGISGHVRALESTHGGNGWHPHLHFILLTEGQLTDEETETLRVQLAARWCDRAQAIGFRRPLEAHQHGERIHSPEAAGKYLGKFGVSAELTEWSQKSGSAGGRVPFQILSDFGEKHRPRDLRLWLEWEKGIKGARFLTWSRGLKARYAITEKTDEEIAEQEEQPSAPLVTINRQLWYSIAGYAGLDTMLLEEAEARGGWAAAELLDTLPLLLDEARVIAIYDDALYERAEARWRSARWRDGVRSCSPVGGGFTLDDLGGIYRGALVFRCAPPRL